MRTRYTLVDLISNIISFVFGLAVLGLAVRFFFRLFGANSGSEIVRFVYNSTAPLLAPFRDIFPTEVIDSNSVVEYPTLVAIVAYLVFAWVLIELVQMFNTYSRERRVTVVS
jgi:uncharacterized protein YggT (Ycf19 family)